ncbi:ATP-dependent RNA helicase-like protein [Hapsidospora chrysogenum ATCC 11550]|uniref:ATP-dependent RNA helicase ROK1 n=1 Tax=Hapsidospora chrysogenum (strain ATCC 11550 / CBS 779.69 / DSM 880 / IAM 14645 / JCM 23072 / IMI 49137) TaxID=857340 RepID=A0A086SU94_HAPC1|nr:ATP-dependent RNA helicase-like protein [Hapsidospora chrysogenum ATCC 11550]
MPAPTTPGPNDPRNSSARDLFRILTRGTKVKASAFDRLSAKLPSAGAKPNPQLFHDDVRGQKRKRQSAHDGADEMEHKEGSSSELPVVDFFAPKPEPEHSANDAPEEDVDEDRETSPGRDAVPPLTKEECRQVLKSHRIKVTLMWKHEERSRVKKSKKKKKREEEQIEAKKEDQKRPLLPQPLESFGQLRSVYGVPRQLDTNLAKEGYREPTEVQLGSLPILLRPELALRDEDGLEGGVDFLAVAPTGSGKTVSFLVTAINAILRRRAQERLHGVHELEAVIVAPTRELVHQIVSEGNKLAKDTGLKVVGMKKGMSISTEQEAADGGGNNSDDQEQSDLDAESEDEGESNKMAVKADILVTTPVRLLKFLTSIPGSTKLMPSVRQLILDEADVLLDALFREQTTDVWMACTNPALRVSCWSATMGSNIETLVTDNLKSRAESLAITPKPLVRLVVGLKDAAVPNIAHKLIFTGTEQGKPYALRQLFRPTSKDDFRIRLPFLVFTETVERAMALHKEIKYDIPASAGGPSRIASLHSNLSDSARAAIVRKFRAGEIWLLITTDIVARGLDFRGVNGVVNYDVPTSSAAYVHRAGRTGRAGREGGVAVTLWTQDDIPILKTVANVIVASERQAGKASDEESAVPKWLLDRLPDVSKAEKKKLKRGGRRSRPDGKKDKITTTSGFERQKENNRRGAIEASKRRKTMHRGGSESGDKEEWNGFGD